MCRLGRGLFGSPRREERACFRARCLPYHPNDRPPGPWFPGLIPSLKVSLFRAPSHSRPFMAFRPELSARGSVPLHDVTGERPRSLVRLPTSLRSVPRRPQPHDGFLRSLAPGLISSPSRVQGPPCPGVSLSEQVPSLIGRSCPLAVGTPCARRTFRSCAHATSSSTSRPDYTKQRSGRSGVSLTDRRSPLQVLSPPGHSAST